MVSMFNYDLIQPLRLQTSFLFPNDIYIFNQRFCASYATMLSGLQNMYKLCGIS